MTAEERIDEAAKRLWRMILYCPNCVGTNRIRVQCVGGTRIEKCHVCAPLRGVFALLTNEESPPAGG
jgi:hypothetical protein